MSPSRLVLALLLTAPAGFAQEILWERVGVDDEYQIGGWVARIGDVDGDGYPELVIQTGVVHPPPFFTLPETEIWVLSGKDGRTLRTLRQPPTHFHYRITEAGDMDGDGLDDYAVTLLDFTNTSVNIVEARSGRDDRLLWSVQGSANEGFGFAILGGIDLDGNGRPDLVVDVPRGGIPGRGGQIMTFDHQGNPHYTVQGTAERFFGFSQSPETLGRLGDLDGDGGEDFVVGGGYAGSGGGGVVLSGRTGTVLQVGVSPDPNDNLGYSVAGCGDLDGDGVPDFAAGNRPLFQRGAVMAFSGATGEVLHAWTSNELGPGFDGHALRSGGVDLDRDGIADLVVGTPSVRLPLVRSVGSVFVLSGREGQTLYRTLWGCGSGALGDSVAALGPWPGSPFPAFAAVDPNYMRTRISFFLPYLGRIVVYRGSPVGTQPYGEPCRGTLNQTPVIGMSETATGTRVTVHGAPPRSPAWLLLGLSRRRFGTVELPWSLEPFGFPGCSLLASLDTAIPVTTGSFGIAAGFAAIDLPGIPAAQGIALHAQWLVSGHGLTEPGGLSDALQWQVR